MTTDGNISSVQDFERRILRSAWWVFPLLGFAVSLVLGDPFWNWVDGGTPPRGLNLGNLGWRNIVLPLVFCAVPVLWRIGLKSRRPGAVCGGLVLAAVLAAELTIQFPRVQAPLWLAARARLDKQQWFMREVCYVRLEEAAGRSSPAPAVILVGSSQILLGVDEQLLRRMISPTPVIRRSMFGMTPLKALAMWAYMPFRPGDICVRYLSEFDFADQDEFPFSWLRPYASYQTYFEVLRCVSPQVRRTHWRQVLDYTVAASSELWRARDFLRQVLFHFWSGDTAAEPGERIPDTGRAIEQAWETPQITPSETLAFGVFARKLEERRVCHLVLEGDVNPAIYSDGRLQVKAQVRADLAAFPGAGLYRFVSKDEQNLNLGPEHWGDMTHLNAGGREVLTRRLAQILMTP